MKPVRYRYIFAGGGTGGHLYPAIAVAEELKILEPESKILFVGTRSKIESRVVPESGFEFKSIWISGFSRKFSLSNILFPLKVIVSFIQSLLINLKFKPSVALGAGAYVSGPIVKAASLLGSKVVLLEQNSYPGVTNRILERNADSIHISFEDSKKYFKQKSKLKLTGNPIRLNLRLGNKIEAVKNFELDEGRKVLLVIGGSLGARAINAAIEKNLRFLTENNIQIIWQTGEYYFDEFSKFHSDMIKVFPFISDMASAYSACDFMVARAGATTIAEVAYLGMPVLFVPSANVAANHQYINAKSIVDKRGGLMIKDSEILDELGKTVVETIYNDDLLNEIKINIKKFSRPEAAKEIAKDVLKLAGSTEGKS